MAEVRGLYIRCLWFEPTSRVRQSIQVGYVPDFHPGSLCLTPAQGTYPQKMKNHLMCLKNGHELLLDRDWA